MPSGKPPIWVVLRAHFCANPHKTGVLIALVVIMAVVYARPLFKSSVPAAADASVQSGAGPGETTSPTAGVTGHVPDPTPPRLTLPGPLSRALARNPFVLDLDKFPGADRTGAPVAVAPVEFVGQDVDDEIRAAANELALQAISYGPSPLACINGQFLQTGQEIAGFVVKRVEPMRVVLRRDGIEVALNLE